MKYALALLNARTATGQLPAGVTRGSLERFPERIVQFGEGNFLRAFADWMIDELNSRDLLRSRVLVVQPIRQGLAAALNAQDGLYTVLARGTDQGRVVDSARIVTAVSRALDPYAQWAALVAAFTGNDLRFVISNTTEAGIAYVEEAFDPSRCPESFPAKIAALLHARFEAQRGSPERGLVFLPCELIGKNGASLRECVLKHAAAWKLPAEFSVWVNESNVFLNTLVDRIVAGYPKAEAAALANRFGYEDKLLVASEIYHLWVIEGPLEIAAELPFTRAGLNVVWTDDLTPYRNRKVRVLNGGHTSSALAAYAAGANTVRELCDDPLLGAFLRRVVFDEIVPQVAQPEAERIAYAGAVLERFANPFMHHELLSIALNSVSKWKVRVLPSLLDAVARNNGRLPRLLAFSLAALVWFYRGEKQADGSFVGRRHSEPYTIRDDAPVIEFFAAAWARANKGHDFTTLAQTVLARTDFWGRDLNDEAGFTATLAEDLANIHKAGMRSTLAGLL